MGQAHADTLKLSIATTAQEVRMGESFTVTATLENVGAQDEPIDFGSCSYLSQFEIDPDGVVWIDAPSCVKNIPRHLTLAPGRRWQVDVPLGMPHWHLRAAQPGDRWEPNLPIAGFREETGRVERPPVQFRLGFHSLNAPADSVIWSNPLTVTASLR